MDGVGDAAVPVSAASVPDQSGARGFILGTKGLLLEHMCGITADFGDSARL